MSVTTGAGLAVAAPVVVLLGLHGALVAVWAANGLFMLAVAGGTAVRMTYIWQRPDRLGDDMGTAPAHPPVTRFSVIVPARHEPVLAATLGHLLAGDYPDDLLEVIVVVADDDPETELLAREVAAQNANVTVLVVTGAVRSKPISLEAARPHCTGELIGVLDAESLMAPGLLTHVDALARRRPRTGIFQGGVQLMNHRAERRRHNGAGLLSPPGEAPSWWRARNCVEYYVWFASRLHFQAEAGFIPLGGNTLFIRAEVLDELGGWDPNCLTEDCDLGVRASAARIRTHVFYRPELVTREETPDSLRALIRQRSRWDLGFLQVLAKGDWLRLPGVHRRLLALEALATPFFQAYCGVMLPVSLLLSLTLTAPVGLVMVSWLPLGATAVTALLEQAAYREFTRAYGLRATWWDSLGLLLSTPLYQLVLSLAAVRAAMRLALRRTGWEKTAHSGAHLAPVPVLVGEGG